MNKKVDIKKLKYPLWFHIVFYSLTVIVPLILIMIEGFGAKSSAFRWTFGAISLILVGWLAVYNWLLKGTKSKIVDRKSKLEHDYEIEVGDSDKIKFIWFSNELKLNVISIINTSIWGIFFALILTGIADGIMAIKGAIIIICTLYVVAFALKVCLILSLRGSEVKGDGENEQTE